jgi:hypothetical protein
MTAPTTEQENLPTPDQEALRILIDPENLPTHAQIRRVLGQRMFERGIYNGVPIPVEGLTMHLESKFPFPNLADVGIEAAANQRVALEELALSENCRVVNSWYSHARFSHVFILQDNVTGKYFHLKGPEHSYVRRLDIMLQGHLAVTVHDLETEATALETLKSHINDWQLRQYVLLGQFLESSPRSGVTYIFRRARPTVAIAGSLDGEHMKILASLCMHPIGYYAHTTVGTMTPTDDVLSHLLLMRGDEHEFWKRCSQHQPHEPEAMI